MHMEHTLLEERVAYEAASDNSVNVTLVHMGWKSAHVEVMYCQSSEILANPRPSLPSVPPNRLVITS